MFVLAVVTNDLTDMKFLPNLKSYDVVGSLIQCRR